MNSRTPYKCSSHITDLTRHVGLHLQTIKVRVGKKRRTPHMIHSVSSADTALNSPDTVSKRQNSAAGGQRSEPTYPGM